MNKHKRKAVESIEGWQKFCDSTDGINSIEKKEQLLGMAKRGEPRPHYKTPLGRALKHYVKKNGNTYDHVFDKQIRNLAPHWFDIAAGKKKQIIKMAKRGEPRPKNKYHPLWLPLRCYTSPTSSCYDKEFHNLIKKLAPSWFVKLSDVKTQQIIELAKKGGPKPTKKNYLYSTFNFRMKKDVNWARQIKKIAPQWFVDDVVENKKQLIKMAKQGLDRPTQRTHLLGKRLTSYTTKGSNCYDAIFDKQIRKEAPHWFKKSI